MQSIQELRKKYLNIIPNLEFDLLLGLSTKKSRSEILTHPEYRLNLKQLVLFYYFIWRFRGGVPVAYLAGQKEFFGLDFLVNKYTLVPRPDTEIMVEEVLKNLNCEFRSPNTLMIDVGTGSACIPIAIGKNLPRPITIYAFDISKPALKVAKKNATTHGIKINFLHGDLLQPILSDSRSIINDASLIITANLPYLSEEQFVKEPSIWREPKSALVAAESGLALYHKLLEQIRLLGKPTTTFLEIDPSQTEKIKQLISSIFPTAVVKIKTDLAGRDRLVILKN